MDNYLAIETNNLLGRGLCKGIFEIIEKDTLYISDKKFGKVLRGDIENYELTPAYARSAVIFNPRGLYNSSNGAIETLWRHGNTISGKIIDGRYKSNRDTLSNSVQSVAMDRNLIAVKIRMRRYFLFLFFGANKLRINEHGEFLPTIDIGTNYDFRVLKYS